MRRRRKSKRWIDKQVTSLEAEPLRMVSNAGVATSAVADGRLLPVLILDTSERPDIDELVRVHEHHYPGDVSVQWCELAGKKGRLYLFLEFLRPIETKALIEFKVEGPETGLVDLVVRARGFYLQPGRSGDRLVNTPENPRILVEVPETGFGQIWEEMYLKHLAAEARRRGIPRADAKRAARQFLAEWRKFGGLRVR